MSQTGKKKFDEVKITCSTCKIFDTYLIFQGENTGL